MIIKSLVLTQAGLVASLGSLHLLGLADTERLGSVNFDKAHTRSLDSDLILWYKI